MTLAPTTLIYDGQCLKCLSFAQWLNTWCQGHVRIVSMDEPGAMDLHLNLSYARAVRAPQLILPNGYLCQGAEAVAWALSLRPGFAWLAVVFHLPLFRQLSHLAYWLLRAKPRDCPTCP